MKYQYALILDSKGNRNLWKFTEGQYFCENSKIESLIYKDTIFYFDFDLDVSDFSRTGESSILLGNDELIVDTIVYLPDEVDEEELVQESHDLCGSLCETCGFKKHEFCNAHGMTLKGWRKVKDCYCYADGITMRKEEQYQDDYGSSDGEKFVLRDYMTI